MAKKIINYLPVIALVSIALLLVLRNYTPGTFLSGWDTLHPEFNFGLNFQRLFFGVFRSEQGLGAVAAHSHMSDLPRVILLYIFNWFAPLSFLRYSYIFLNLILGPIGMYFFLKKIVLKNRAASFLGGLFYLLNLGTLQRFIVPFEMFTTQYAMLPWIFLFATQYLQSADKNRKSLILFTLVMLFSAPMAYAATLWYITFACLFLYLFALSLPTLIKKDFFVFKRTISLILVSLLINSFWILPNIYFVLTSGTGVTYANINTLFSPQAFLYNKEFGNLKDIALIKNFLFDWGAYMGGNHFGNLLSVWIDYLNKPYVTIIGFFFASVAILGLIYTIVKKNKIGLSFLPVLILVLFFLINDNPPTSFLYRFLEQNIPLFKEAFRFPADKVLGIFILVFSLYFALGQMAIIALIKKLPSFSIKSGIILQTVIISGLLIYYMMPAFNGNLISPLMRIKMPSYYFDVFSYFNRQKDDGRIANLPIQSPWGWEYYDWYKDKPRFAEDSTRRASYQGAGFIWFGIKQPLLNRDFDRWNPLNEQYYREMSYAVYSKSDDLFKAVLGKYNIHYILLDENIIAPENDTRILYYNELGNILDKLEKQDFIKKDAQFGKIKIFKVIDNPNYAYLIDNYAKVSPKSSSYYEDFAYIKYKDYVTWEKTEGATFYPFRDLIDTQSHILKDRIKISQEGAEINFKKQNNSSLPSIIEAENFIIADLFLERTNNKITINIYPRLPYKNSSQFILPISTSFDFKDTSFIVSVNRTSNFSVDNLETNAPFSAGTVLLNTKTDNTISVYPNTPDQIETADLSSVQFSLSSCEAKTPDQVFGVERQTNGFIIFGKKASVCMTIPLTNLFPNVNQPSKDVLLTTYFTYDGAPLSYVCVADLKTGSCLSYRFKNISSGSFATNLSYLGIEKNNLSNLSIKVFLDATQTEGLEKVKYSDVSFSLTKPVSSASFSKDLIKQSISAVRSNLNSVLIPFSGNREESQDITTLPRNSINCSQFSPLNHKISKKIISKDRNNYIEYESGEGTACDHFSYSNLMQNQGYLLLVTSRNIQGLPLTMCVLNQASRHCDLYTNLSKSSQFTTDTFLIAPIQDNETGYDVNIASLGIKGTKSINDLASIQFIPLPYYFLSKMEEGQRQNISQRVSIENQIDENSSFYSIKLKNLVKNSVLAFSKSYETGWSAYEMVNSKWSIVNGLKLALPFVFGKELKNHVMVNNWENGWILDESSIVDGQSSIVIVYLPQYLQYIGFLLSIGILIYIVFRYIFRSKNDLTHPDVSDKLPKSENLPHLNQ